MIQRPLHWLKSLNIKYRLIGIGLAKGMQKCFYFANYIEIDLKKIEIWFIFNARDVVKRSKELLRRISKTDLSMGSSINDVTQFLTSLPSLSHVLSLRPEYYHLKIIDFIPHKTVTSFIDDPYVVKSSKLPGSTGNLFIFLNFWIEWMIPRNVVPAANPKMTSGVVRKWCSRIP